MYIVYFRTFGACTIDKEMHSHALKNRIALNERELILIGL